MLSSGRGVKEKRRGGKGRRGKRLKGEMGKGERRAEVILIPFPLFPFYPFTPASLFPFFKASRQKRAASKKFGFASSCQTVVSSRNLISVKRQAKGSPSFCAMRRA